MNGFPKEEKAIKKVYDKYITKTKHAEVKCLEF